ncbi:AAA-like domain protein [Caulifigura coniformis]|uniref:AAA-like domain protein n=2 Tax=Caulifigura coniformis TaxID=2527983 RepID=A0A517SCM7_9PLAN|nr:AAA-like domain protein [Caulifigura coniformis]
MTATPRTPSDPIENLAIGRIIEVDGPHVVAELDAKISELTRVFNGVLYPIGQFGSIVKIHFGRRMIYGYVSRLRMKADFNRERGIAADGTSSARIIEADLFGEGEWTNNGGGWKLEFERGVSTFPLPQQGMYLTPRNELADVFGRGSEQSFEIGEHVGSGGTPCFLDLDELLGKHTTVLGSTGSGKSSAVAGIVHSILRHGQALTFPVWMPRIIILDPHNEYGGAFHGHTRLSTDEGSLSLPYWMLDLEETIALYVGKTEFAATSQTNIVKNALLSARRAGAAIVGVNPDDITVDSPIPYVLGNPVGLDNFGSRNGALDKVGFVGQINEQRPKDSKDKSKHDDFNKVVRKLESLLRDSRLKFMMRPWNGEKSTGDLSNVLQQFLGKGHPVCVFDLSGVPNEVAGAASSAVARTLFAAKLWQTVEERARNPVLLICEEAHRYVPDKGDAQYAAARHAIQRLAKEGRKYGIALMLVSQRPSEVDATVLSQCNSWIVLRITNDSDREHVRAILPDSLVGLTKVLSGLRQREAVVVGQATALPSRILIRKLEEHQLPRSNDISFSTGWQSPHLDSASLSIVARRWQTQERLAAELSSMADGPPSEDAPPF